MKNIFIFMIIGLFAVGIISSSAVFGGSMDSPRKQMAMGTAAEDVLCNLGYDLMLRSSGSAACVTPSTAMKLENSGWGTITKTAAMMEEEIMDVMEGEMMDDVMEDEMMDDVMEDEMMDDIIETMSIGGIDVTMSAPLEGSPDAPITIIEFGDFQCPKCNQWFQNEKSAIVENHIDTGIAKVYFLDYTWLGDDSTSAAQAAHCAGDQEMYWEYHTNLYNNQGGINEGWASPDNLKAFAEEMGLDAETFNECLDSGKYDERVSHNNMVGASHDVEGTPTFFIISPDGSVERINGPQPASTFDKVIESFS